MSEERKSCFRIEETMSGGESHCLRSRVEVENAYEDLSGDNLNWVTDVPSEVEKGLTYRTRKEYIQEYCKKVTGRAFNKNAKPLRTGVAVMMPHHGEKDMHAVCKALKEEFNIEVYRWSFHADEGHVIEGGMDNVPEEDKYRAKPLNNGDALVINHHGHFFMDWQEHEKNTLLNKKTGEKENNQGKMMRFNRQDFSRIQDIVADTLGMPRGEMNKLPKSKRATEYREKAQKKRVALQASFQEECPSLTAKEVNTLINTTNGLEKKEQDLLSKKRHYKKSLRKMSMQYEKSLSGMRIQYEPLIKQELEITTSLKKELEPAKEVTQELNNKLAIASKILRASNAILMTFMNAYENEKRKDHEQLKYLLGDQKKYFNVYYETISNFNANHLEKVAKSLNDDFEKTVFLPDDRISTKKKDNSLGR